MAHAITAELAVMTCPKLQPDLVIRIKAKWIFTEFELWAHKPLAISFLQVMFPYPWHLWYLANNFIGIPNDSLNKSAISCGLHAMMYDEPSGAVFHCNRKLHDYIFMHSVSLNEFSIGTWVTEAAHMSHHFTSLLSNLSNSYWKCSFLSTLWLKSRDSIPQSTWWQI